MAVFSLTNSAQRIDQAVNAVHSGSFVNGTGVVYSQGDQTISGAKTFNGNLIARAGADFSGNISGELSPHNDNLTNLGAANKRFQTGYIAEITGTNAVFGGNVTILGTLSANLDVGVTGISVLSVTQTGYIQNLRVTGQSTFGGQITASGGIVSHGQNSFTGTSVFGAASFSNVSIFESGISVTGASTFQNTATFVGEITAGAVSQDGEFNSTGAFTHTGALYQGGNSFFTGDVGINGDLSVTGDATIIGTNTVRAASFFTTGNNANDRFRIQQNIDITGDWNQTGSARISNGLNVLAAGANVTGGLTVRGTGNLDGAFITGDVQINGTSTLTGTTSLRGNANISGSIRISGDLTIVGTTGNTMRIDRYFRPFVVASGIGSSRVDTLTAASFWTTTRGAASPGTGIWLTQYVGTPGEIGVFLTGSNSVTAIHNMNLPVGTYGRAFFLVNAGSTNGSGVWTLQGAVA